MERHTHLFNDGVNPIVYAHSGCEPDAGECYLFITCIDPEMLAPLIDGEPLIKSPHLKAWYDSVGDTMPKNMPLAVRISGPGVLVHKIFYPAPAGENTKPQNPPVQ